MIRTLFALLFATFAGTSQAETLKMAVTTSFHNSGLSDVLLPRIRADTGLDVQLLIVGTGQALRLGEAGDVDAILVHSRAAEEAFVAAGNGTHRREIMFNDFVLIGPMADPADIANAASAVAALERIATAKAPFVSRGDDSGTHKMEQALWRKTALDTATFTGWYKEVGAGMGAALNTATAIDAYVLADRASWLNFDNQGRLTLLFSGDPVLFNQYTYIPVNPTRHGHVNHAGATQLEAWLTGETARSLINAFQINGETLFTFNAR